MAVWLQVKVRGRGFCLRSTGCTPALSMTQKSAAAAAAAAYGAI